MRFSLLELYIIFNFSLYLLGNLLAFGTHSGCVQAWDVVVGRRISKMKGHSGGVDALAWNVDVVLSGSHDGLILQRDIRAPSTAVGHMKEVSRRLFVK
jgi:cell division cycle protein 20 (cofactor of APC complex)